MSEQHNRASDSAPRSAVAEVAEVRYRRRSLLSRFSPFSRSAVTDPYAVYQLEDQASLAGDFLTDANTAVLYQDPLRARRSIFLVLMCVGIFIVWAAFAKVDEITRGEGKVIPSRQIQIVQSLDGGIVREILAKEGQVVKEGDVLLKIDATRVLSSFKEGRAAYLALLAKAARLRAVAEGMAFVPPPEVLAEEPSVAVQEEILYRNRRAELESQVGIARQQLNQRNSELNEVRERLESASKGLALTTRELTLTKPLVESGAASDVDLLRLQRDVVRFQGENNQALAQISRLHAAISEAQTKIQNVELEFRNQARTELADVQAKISGLAQSSVALSDKVSQTDIKSPVLGTVKRLLFNTVGGVVPPGRDILEIVPLEDALLLEAKVNTKDIAFLRPGQKANIKFTAYDFAIYGGLEGHLEHISADSVLDDKGQAYYLVRVRTVKPSLGSGLPIIPGMVVEVDILTGRKSILSYLLKPLLRGSQYALTER